MKQAYILILIAFFIVSCNNNKDNQLPQSKTELQASNQAQASNQVQATTSTETNINSQKETKKDTSNIKTKENKSSKTTNETDKTPEKPKYPIVTFIELGSVNCIPCKRMQPIMKSLEAKYGEQLKVIFYDVWKPEFKPKANEYKIKLIPTQVFLDYDGKEIHRHEGFYPEEEIDKFLASKGLKIINSK